MLFLLFMFTAFPILELYLLFQAGDEIGGVNTFFIVILTGIIGASLARNQGRLILGKIQSEMSRGQMPADQLIHGFLVFAGGLLLLTPGFITDVVGISLVLPFTRFLFTGHFKKGLEKRMKAGSVQYYSSSNNNGGGFNNHQTRNHDSDQPKVFSQNGHDVIDVEAIKND